MSRYQKYPAYKDSGVEWIGEIPEHWEITKIRYYYDVQLGKMLQPESKTETDVEVKYLKAQHVQWNVVNHDDLPTMWASEKEIEKFAVQQGDLLICEGGEVGRSALLDGVSDVCIIQNALHRVRAKEKSSVKYLQYFMQHVSNARWFDILCNKATIAHLTGEKLAALELPVPPVHEQQAIASFLDSRTEKIDELIAKKESLLNKLHEKSIALIIQAVTKGLDLSVPMKESGVNWIGKIPEHWTIWKVTHGFNTVGSGTTPKSDNLEYYDGDIPWVTTSELRESIIENTSQKISVDALQSHSALKIFPKESIVIAMYGATIGRLGILGIKATVNQACCVFANPVTFDPRFFYYWLLMRKPILISLSTGGGQPNLSLDDLKQIKIPIPSLQEQEAIAIFLDQATATVDLQREKITEAIERLKEYRSALITDAVTGKMDVHSYETKESFLPEQKRI